MRSVFALAVVVLLSSSLLAQTEKLSVTSIYGSGKYRAKSVGVRWMPDGKSYTKVVPSKQIPGASDLVGVEVATGKTTVLVAAAELRPSRDERPISIQSYAWSRNRSHLLIYTNSRRVWRQNTRGDYYVLDRTARELFRLGGDAKSSSLMFAKFSPDGRYVSYVRDGDLFAEDLRDRKIHRLTTQASGDIIHGTFDWVYEEELGLRDGSRWSPDGKSLTFWQLDTTGVPEVTLVDNASGLYPRLQKIKYPKTGQKNSAARVGIVDVPSGEIRWVAIPGDARNHYIARMEWVNAKAFYVQQLNRLQNTNRVYLVDRETLKPRLLFTEKDDAWVDLDGEIKSFAENTQFAWLSERSGWKHLYRGNWKTGRLIPMTTGEFDVIQLLHVDESRRLFYFIASPKNAAQRYLFAVDFDGKNLKKVTPNGASGSHSYRISPDGKHAVHTYSAFGKPPAITLISLPDHREVRVLQDNKALLERMGKLEPIEHKFLRIDIGTAKLDAWMMRPAKIDPMKKYPLVIYVYGEPAGQTVRDSWGGSGYLWHRMLVERGYAIVSIDNRGTKAPKGRAWRKSIYRKVGIVAPEDQAAALKALLKENPWLDAKRVGIWGWSGGGSMSLNAMFKHPDLYRAAISIAPVPNQRGYDTIYQERYMGLPSDNVAGYREGSPINFAKNLKGDLLIVHGTGDDNCHYQGTVALINQLIRDNKQFRMMAYPNRSHSIREGHTTTRHLRNMMTKFFEEKLR